MTSDSHRRVAARYQLEERLGLGGMGEVYRAFDEVLSRWVALKRLRSDRPLEESARRRLEREARLVARLSHPSVVRLYDVVRWQDDLWLVMELVRGQSLADLLARGPLEEGRALALAEEISAGLGAAHEREIVHRDLKAENVLVQLEGHARILDFGLALEALGPQDDPLTGETELVGTRRAMAPEQLLGRAVDGRADLFSLGVLLYEMTTGESPFAADNPLEVSHRVLHHAPPSPDVRNPHMDPAFAQLILRLLEKNPEARPPSAEAVARELARIRAGWERRDGDLDRTTGSHDVVKLPDPIPSPSPSSPPSRASREPATAGGTALRRRHLAVLLAAVLMAVLALAVGAWVSWSGSASPAPPDLDVAVAAPQVVASEAFAKPQLPGASFLGPAVWAATLEGLAGLGGIAAYSTESLEAEPVSASAAGRALAVDEVVVARLECLQPLCQATLSRLSGEDGRVLDVVSFELPPDDPSLVRRAVLARLRSLYPDRRWSGPEPGELPAEVYGEFLRLRSEVLQGRADEELLEAFGELRQRAPGFVEIYLLEAQTARQRFSLSRDPVLEERVEKLLEQASQRAPEDARVLLQRFDLAYDTESWELAEEVLAELERRDPSSAQVLSRRAELLAQRGEIEEALARMRRAVLQRPSFSLRFNLALMEYHHGEIDSARRTLGTLVEQDPGSRLARSFLAQIELTVGDVSRARDIYLELVTLAPGALELSNLGFAQLLLGDAVGALASFRQAAGLEPANASISLNLADALALLGRREEGREAYLRTLELVDRDPAVADWQRFSVRAQALAHLGRRREAVAAIQGAMGTAREIPQVYYEAALVYTLVGDRTSALINAERALAGGVQPSWFQLPWFEELRADPELRDRFGGLERSKDAKPGSLTRRQQDRGVETDDLAQAEQPRGCFDGLGRLGLQAGGHLFGPVDDEELVGQGDRVLSVRVPRKSPHPQIA